MSPWALHAMADSRCREMRRDVALHTDGIPHPPSRPVTARQRWPRMRRQVGYALVEAGLHLLATAGPASRG
jgi:hypothetical protein